MMDTAPLIDVQSEREKGNEETDDGRCGYVHADHALSYPLLDGVPKRQGLRRTTVTLPISTKIPPLP